MAACSHFRCQEKRERRLSQKRQAEKSGVLERPIVKIVLLKAAAEVPEETKGPVKACVD